MEAFLNQVHRFRRVWQMGILGRTLVIVSIVMAFIVIVIFIWDISEISGLVRGIWVAFIFVLLVWISILASYPNLKVVCFQGGPQPVKQGSDYPEHVTMGDAIAGYVVTVKNTGGTRLFLEPKLILIDHKTHEPLTTGIDILPNPSKTKERYYKSDTSKHLYQSPPYCNKTLELNKDEDQKTVLMEFLIDKFWVERLGENWPYRLYNAESILKLIDKGNNVIFECSEIKAGKYTCKKSRYK